MNDTDEAALNSWICEHLMGFTSGQLSDDEIPHYTTDPAHAFEVLKKCSESISDEHIEIENPAYRGDGKWAVFNKFGEFLGSGETLELAICQFAKKLFEVKP